MGTQSSFPRTETVISPEKQGGDTGGGTYGSFMGKGVGLGVGLSEHIQVNWRFVKDTLLGLM
jgi:hypothetical protein